MAIADKIKKFKFTKINNTMQNKDADWFKKLNCPDSKSGESPGKCPVMDKVVDPRTGLSQDEERQINRELIPWFKQKQEELQPDIDYYKQVGKTIKELRD